jgi:hypothetical protein
MSETALAAKKTVEVGKKQILDQCFQIERQLYLIARHERDGYPDLVTDAVRILGEMERALARMEAHYANAQEHLAQVTVDEPSLANVERDTPSKITAPERAMIGHDSACPPLRRSGNFSSIGDAEHRCRSATQKSLVTSCPCPASRRRGFALRARGVRLSGAARGTSASPRIAQP